MFDFSSIVSGVISHYEVRWKLSSDSAWKESVASVKASDSLCSSTEAAPETVCLTLPDLEPDDYTLEVRTFNQDVPNPSAWSEQVLAVVTDKAAEEDGLGFFSLTNIVILVLLACLLAVGVTLLCLRLKKSRKKPKSRQDFEQISQDDFSRPIFRPVAAGPAHHHPRSDSNSYVARPGSLRSQRSGKDPLPELPCTENIYSDLVPKLEEEDNYLKPNPVVVTTPVASAAAGGFPVPQAPSSESLDEEGYLRPNFNRFQRLDTSGSDREHSPPLIPPVSYLASSGSGSGEHRV